jgi:long-chain acyl-CoA synthetase
MAGPAVLTVLDTIAKSFLLAVETRGDRPAIREKKFGIWQPTSWRQWLQISKREIAYGLHAPASARRRRLDHRQRTCRNGCYADMGILCAAASPTASIRPTPPRRSNTSSTIPAPLPLRRGRGAARQGAELRARAARRCEDRRVRHGGPARLQRSDGDVAGRIRALGRATHRRAARRCGTRWSQAATDDLAILVYTSGTTGPPKGAMHSNRSVTHQMRHANDLARRPTRRALVFLPLCHVAERVGGYYISLALGSVMNFAEKPGDGAGQLREVQPTAFLAVPRVWEKFYSGVTIALKERPRSRTGCTPGDRRRGNRLTDCKLEGERRPLSLRSPTRLADWLVFRNISAC